MASSHTPSTIMNQTPLLMLSFAIALAMSGVDRISVLPDSVLIHILSFLPSKTAVATCVLSSRWRVLWRSVPTVDLDSSLFGINSDMFFRFASAVLLAHGVTRPILNFRLRCERVASCDVDALIYAAKQHPLETLELSSGYDSPMKLPSAALTCSSLVLLKLKDIIVDHTTSTVHLPNLKTLHMDGVRLAKGEYLEMILAGCPNIHHLQIKGLVYKQAFAFLPPDITFPNLIKVVLSAGEFKWFWILRLLNSSPMLQVLDVGGDKLKGSMVVPADQPYPQTIPGCLSSHLRDCTLRDFYGDDADIQFATYIWRNAGVLKSMITCCPPRDQSRILERCARLA